MMDWTGLRQREFPDLDGISYLNAASTGPLPLSAFEKVLQANRDRMRPDRWTKDRMDGVLAESRRLAAALIGAKVEEIALMPNTTTGINVAARAVPLSPGDIVVTFDREFPTNVYPWLARAHEGIVLERVPCTPAGWPDEPALMRRLQDPKVRAVCVSLTQFSNGYTIDLNALSRQTRALGKWLIVDAMQAIGNSVIDVRATPVDFLACGAQKWLLSPWGTGFLYVRHELIGQFPPTFAGWASYIGTDDYTRLTSYDPRPWPDARRYEVITLPAQDFEAMNVVLTMMVEIGLDVIAARVRALSEPLIAAAQGGGAVLTSPLGDHGSAITCLRPTGDVAAFHTRLERSGVICSLREGAVRLSPHLYNTEADINAVLNQL